MRKGLRDLEEEPRVEGYFDHRRRLDAMLAEDKEFPIFWKDRLPCMICRNVKPDEWVWYDKWGPKCRPCHMTMKRRALPITVCTDRKSWMDDWEARHALGVSAQKLGWMVRKGELSPRVVKGTGFRVYLLSENPGLGGEDAPDGLVGAG